MDLWLVHRHGGEPLLHPELAAMSDAFETPARGPRRPAAPAPRRVDARLPRAGARVATRPRREGPARSTRWCPARAAAQRDDAAGDRARAPPTAPGAPPAPERGAPAPRRGLDPRRPRLGPFALGAPDDRFAFDNERPAAASTSALRLIGRTAGSPTPRSSRSSSRAGATSAASGGPTGVGVEGGVRHQPPRGLGRRARRLAAVAHRRLAPCTPSRWSTLLVRGRTPSPGAHGARLPAGPSGRGGDLDPRARTILSEGRADTSTNGLGPHPRSARAASPHHAEVPAGSGEQRQRPVADARRTPGGPRPISSAPGRHAHPYREYSEVFFGAHGYLVTCAAGSWAPSEARAALGGNWDLPHGATRPAGGPPGSSDGVRREPGIAARPARSAPARARRSWRRSRARPARSRPQLGCSVRTSGSPGRREAAAIAGVEPRWRRAAASPQRQRDAEPPSALARASRPGRRGASRGGGLPSSSAPGSAARRPRRLAA